MNNKESKTNKSKKIGISFEVVLWIMVFLELFIYFNASTKVIAQDVVSNKEMLKVLETHQTIILISILIYFIVNLRNERYNRKRLLVLETKLNSLLSMNMISDMAMFAAMDSDPYDDFEWDDMDGLFDSPDDFDDND